MDVLILESFSWTPHLQTAGEIAITEAVAGKKTGFSFIYTDNPDEIHFVPEKFIYKFVGARWENKVYKLQSNLRKYGVAILGESSLSQEALEEVKKYAQNAPDLLSDLKEYRYKNADLGLSVVSSLISQTRSLYPDLDLNRTLVQRYLLSSAIVYEKAKAAILRVKPQKVITFNGRFACSKGISEAGKHLGVEVQYHERGATYDRYELFQEQPHDFAYIRELVRLYWQQAGVDREEIGHAFYKRRRMGDGIGWISFTSEQEKNLVPNRSDKHQIVYYSSSDDEFAAVGDLVNYPIFGSQRDAVKALMQWVANQQNSLLTIRVHPHLQIKSSDDRDWWNSLKGRNVQVIPSDSKIDSYALMDWADVVVSYGSTTGIEAAYWGKPSILLGDSFYSGLGCVYEPKSEAELYTLLGKSNLAPLLQAACLPYGYYGLCAGRHYKYYTPHDLFGGDFLNESLTVEPRWYEVAKSSIFAKIARNILKRV